MFENIIDSCYLDSQIRDDFTCTKACYTHNHDNNTLDTRPQCTHTYDHISQQLNSLADIEQQHKVYTNEEDTSLFTSNISTQCTFNIISSTLETEAENHTEKTSQNNTSIHFHSKHKYRDTFRDAHVQYHNFDNGDAYTYKDKHTALLQQELQNCYWCLHDPITTKSYQISTEMDIETMPHAMYFLGNTKTITKINHVPHQTIQYDKKGMFPAQLMDDTPIQVFIDNGATSPFSHLVSITNTQYYKNIQKPNVPHPSTHLIELPLKLENQVIQIKVLVCDLECPYDILIGRTSLAHLSAWQDYTTNKLYIQQISIPIVAKNNVRILPGCTGIVSAALKKAKTTFTPRNTIMGKGIAYVRLFDSTLPL